MLSPFMQLKPRLVQVEKPITVSQLLKDEFGSKSNLYFVSVNGEMGKTSTILKSTDEVKVIAKIAGG